MVKEEDIILMLVVHSKGMVVRAFDTNTAITLQAVSENKDQLDHAFIIIQYHNWDNILD